MAYSIGLKPFSLKGEDDEPITRNNKIKWEYNMKAFTGATPSWQQFLSGGTHDSWLPLDEDPGRGVVVHPVHVNDPTDRRAVDYALAAAANRTNQMRCDLTAFLTCWATYSPEGFFDSIMRESTSVHWILEQIDTTYDLQTKKENLLSGDEINFTITKKFTYQHVWMQLKAFYMNGLLPANSICKGKALADPEVLSPMAECLLVKDWLVKIDPRLPNYIRKTRGNLFTPLKPTLACNQNAICDKIPQMLSELNKDADSANISRLAMSQTQFQQKPKPLSYQPRNPPNTNPQFQKRQSSTQQPSCYHCLQAGRVDAAKTHISASCYSQTGKSKFNRPGQGQRQRFAMVRLIDVAEGEELSQAGYEMATHPDMHQLETMMPILSTYEENVGEDGYVPL